MKKNKKKLIVFLIIIVLILFIPIPLKLKDGGSVEYKALLYKITKYNQIHLKAEGGYIKGWKIELLGIRIYEKKENDEISSQAQYLFGLKNKYLGDASANIKLLEALEINKLAKYKTELYTTKKPYVLYINFTDSIDSSNLTTDSSLDLKNQMRMYSIILLALIENADEIHYNDRYCDCIDNIIKLSTEDLKEKYGNIKDYGNSVEKLEELLNRIEYMSSSMKDK